jgi:hypothetical protein
LTKIERGWRETLGLILTFMGLLCIFGAPYFTFLEIGSYGFRFSIPESISAEDFGTWISTLYGRWILLLIVGLILRTKMFELLHFMTSKKIIVYTGIVLGALILGTIIWGLFQPINNWTIALAIYLPFLVNGAILLWFTKDLPEKIIR